MFGRSAAADMLLQPPQAGVDAIAAAFAGANSPDMLNRLFAVDAETQHFRSS